MLKLETIYTSEFFKIEVDTAKALAKTEWLRHVTDEELKEGAMQLKQVLINHEIEMVLANAKKLSALKTESKEWLATFYYNTLSQTPVKKLARILPANLFHHIALESVMTRAEAMVHLNYSFKNFAEEEEALNWLLTS
ncbi:hypothetical protein ACSX1A_16540 [Pontibacter sp. MBLB2868]|uniref:hypothetical protein n=1 Tax=Pontibacter sp. MBLB2868 TaxID=3451555 RepID=UPI003F74E4C1